MNEFELKDFDQIRLNYINSLLKVNNIKISKKQEENRLEAIKLFYKAKLLSEEASYVVSNYDFDRLYLLPLRSLVNELEGLTMEQVKEENLSKLDIIKKIVYSEGADIIPLEIFELIVSRLDIESIKNLAIAMGFKLTNKYLKLLEKIRNYNINKIPGSSNFIKEAVINASKKGDIEVIKYFVDGNYYNDYNILLKEYTPKNDVNYLKFIEYMRRKIKDKIEYPEDMIDIILINDYIKSFKVLYQSNLNLKVFILYLAYLNSIQILRYLVEILENIRENVSYDDFESLYENVYNEALLYACYSKGQDTFNFLLDISDINYQNPKTGNNALMIVSKKGDEEKLTRLLKIKSLNMNLKNSEGNTALMESYTDKNDLNFKIVKILSVDLFEIVVAGKYKLRKYIDIYKKASKIIPLLLTRNDIDVNIKNSDDDTALIENARFLKDIEKHGQIDDIISRSLLNNKNIDVTLNDNRGENALMLFCENKYSKDVVKKILAIDNTIINDQNDTDDTALMYALNEENEETVDELLKIEEININIQNDQGYTALILGIINNLNTIVMKLLKRSDIDIDILDNDGYNAFYHIFDNDLSIDTSIADYMLENFVIDVNKKFNNGKTIFMNVCEKQTDYEIIKFVSTLKGINLNIQDDNGNTGLLLAVNDLLNLEKPGKFYFVNTLILNEKINVNVKNNNGYTVLLLFIHCLRKDVKCGINKQYIKLLIKSLLKRKDINVNIKNNDGNTALDMLEPKGNKQIQQLLIKKK